VWSHDNAVQLFCYRRSMIDTKVVRHDMRRRQLSPNCRVAVERSMTRRLRVTLESARPSVGREDEINAANRLRRNIDIFLLNIERCRVL